MLHDRLQPDRPGWRAAAVPVHPDRCGGRVPLLCAIQLSFDTLAEHREALLAFRDAHYLWAVLGFIAVYIAIVGLSLPGAHDCHADGRVSVRAVSRACAFNVCAASTGAVVVFLAARAGFGAAMAGRIAAEGGAAARLQAALRENEWSVLLTMRLVPAVPFFLANLIPAFVGVRLVALCDHDVPRHHSGGRWSSPRSARGWARSSPRARRRIWGSFFAPGTVAASGACGAGGAADGDEGLHEGGLNGADRRRISASSAPGRAGCRLRRGPCRWARAWC